MKNRILHVFLLSAAIFCFICSQAEAVTLRVNQAKIRLMVDPGETKTGVIEVENPSDQTLTVKASLEDWEYSASHDGAKEFFPQNTTKHSCANWISFFPPEFIMTPYSKQKLNYSVKVPQDITDGHYAVLFLETSTPNPSAKEGVGMNVVIRIGSLFYIEPKGLVARKAETSNFSLQRKPEDSSLVINIDLKNSGNADITAAGNYSIIDKNGMVYARGGFPDAYTFPGDTAKLTASWKEFVPEGKYSLVLTLDIGKSLEEAGLGRGPIIVKESEIEIGKNNKVLQVGELK